MLASRLLSILMLLQARGRMSAAALAEEFEVSIRTIHRDVDQLSAAGIPIYAERGRAGGFALLDGYRTKLTGLTKAEAETLFLAGLPGPAAELGLADLLSTAQLKLMAALPAGMEAERIAQRFHLDPTGWFHNADRSDLLPEIARAVWNEKYLRIRYRSSGQVYPRKLGPIGLVLKGGVWYLVAQSGKAVRTYRCSQIAETQILDEAYARPKHFDLAGHWSDAARDYEAGLFRETARVRLSPRGRSLLGLLGPQVVDAAQKSMGPPDRDGWVECAIPIESAETGLRELMRLGGDVEVLAPATLRAAMAAMASGIAGRHKRKL
ncbi:MAG TPA: YafY family protein [Rhizomicrobium sp.]|jgi:predicted DNA-binding transcriptional regulator YafY